MYHLPACTIKCSPCHVPEQSIRWLIFKGSPWEMDRIAGGQFSWICRLGMLKAKLQSKMHSYFILFFIFFCIIPLGMKQSFLTNSVGREQDYSNRKDPWHLSHWQWVPRALEPKTGCTATARLQTALSWFMPWLFIVKEITKSIRALGMCVPLWKE